MSFDIHLSRPVFYHVQVTYETTKTWLSRKVCWLIELQRKTGLVKQTCYVLLDIAILVDKIFKDCPKIIGKTALFTLNALGISSFGFIDDIHKGLNDLSLALIHLEIRGIILAFLKVSIDIIDFILLWGVCSASSLALFGYSDRSKQLYAIMHPYGISSYLVRMTLTGLDLYVNTKLVDELKKVPSDKRNQITELFCNFLINPYDIKAYNKESSLPIRVIRQLSRYDLKPFRELISKDLKGWKPSKPLSKKRIVLIEPYYDKIVKCVENQLWHKSKDIKLRILGYVGMGIVKLYPNSIIQSITETFIASLWLYKGAESYFRNG